MQRLKYFPLVVEGISRTSCLHDEQVISFEIALLEALVVLLVVAGAVTQFFGTDVTFGLRSQVNAPGFTDEEVEEFEKIKLKLSSFKKYLIM